MSNGTSREYRPPEQHYAVLRAKLELVQALLEQHGAVVDRTPLPNDALAPKIAAERQRLRAIERP